MTARTILLIDDEDALRGLIADALRAAGYQVVTAGNGQEANLALESGTIDLVVTDLIMPKMDGIEVLTELHRTKPQMPVIVMSGGGRMPPGQYLEMARTFGAEAIIEKPFSPSQLVKMVGSILSKPKE